MLMTIPPAKLLIVGNLGSGKTTLRHAVAAALDWPHTGIDDARRRHGDGRPAGEARAWAAFLAHAQDPAAGILECTGAGPWSHLLRLALRESGLPLHVVEVRARIEVCRARVQARTQLIPYPRFEVPLEQVLVAVARELGDHLAGLWPPALTVIDGEIVSPTAAAVIARRMQAGDP